MLLMISSAAALLSVAIVFPNDLLSSVAAVLLLIVGSVLALHLLSRASESCFDFSEKHLTQTYSGIWPHRERIYDLREFNTVTSTVTFSRSGPNGITVSIRGPSKTVDIAWFGWEAIDWDGTKYDHPSATALRTCLTQELGLRDLGVI